MDMQNNGGDPPGDGIATNNRRQRRKRCLSFPHLFGGEYVTNLEQIHKQETDRERQTGERIP